MRRVCVLLLLCVAPPTWAARSVCWTTTALMWDPEAGRAVPVTPAMQARLERAFKLWEDASAGTLSLRYVGRDAPSHDSTTSIRRDGCVHAVLHGERNFGGELAHGRQDGALPEGYERGWFFVSRKPGAADLDTLAHEIGHALGLPHAATPESIMFSGPRAGGDAPRALDAQDGADLRARWAPWTPGVFTIEGEIVSAREHPTANLFAVPTRSGRSWAARTDHRGRFLLALGEPGEYRLIARPVTVARDLNEDALGGFRETVLPGTIGLSAANRSVRGVRLATLDDRVAPRARVPPPAGGAPTRLSTPAGAGGRPPLLSFSFDHGFDDEGPLRLKSTAHGDEVRLVAGLKGTALFVGGTKDWLDAPLSSAVALEHGFTLEFWFRRADWLNPYRGGSGWQTLAALTTDASLAVTAPGCPLHKPWALEAAVDGAGPGGQRDVVRAFTEPGVVAAERWHHAAMVYDPAERSVAVYLDGRSNGAARGAPTPRFNIRQLRLGTWHEDNQAFRGVIDELAVYDYPRSAAAIAASAAAAR